MDGTGWADALGFFINCKYCANTIAGRPCSTNCALAFDTTDNLRPCPLFLAWLWLKCSYCSCDSTVLVPLLLRLLLRRHHGGGWVGTHTKLSFSPR